MSYRRESQHEGWPRWLREHRAELIGCGVPSEAYETEAAWFSFLRHGYVWSSDRHISDWWRIKMLKREQAERLRGLLVAEYADRYVDLVRELESIAAGSAG